jgi:hypothetical protein
MGRSGDGPPFFVRRRSDRRTFIGNRSGVVGLVFGMTLRCLTRYLACAALGACQVAPEELANRSEGPVAATALPTPSPTPTTDATMPAVLTEADVAAAALEGELACGFTDSDGRLRLIARGNAGTATPAAAIVRLNGTVARLTAPGGFDTIVKRARFAGEDTTIRIEPAGPAIGGGESPPRPATLTLERVGAEPFATAGDWTCGP